MPTIFQLAANAGPDDLVRAFRELFGVDVVRGRVRCPMPDHVDANPSCTISVGEDGRARWSCWSCKARGDLVDLVRLARRDPRSIVGIMESTSSKPCPSASRRGDVVIDGAVKLRAARMFRANLGPGRVGLRARTYLASRGVTESQIERFGLGASAGHGSLAEGLVDVFEVAEALGLVGHADGRSHDAAWSCERVVFPVTHERGEVVGFVGRMACETRKARRWVCSSMAVGSALFGLLQARKRCAEGRELALAEGCLDALALDRVGLAGVALLGSQLYPGQLALVVQLARAAAGSARGRVMLALDGDAEGRAATRRIGKALVAAGLEVDVVAFEAEADPASVDNLADATRDRMAFVVWSALYAE